MSLIIPDIDTEIIALCDIVDFSKIMFVNKYYFDFITGQKLFIEWSHCMKNYRLKNKPMFYLACKFAYVTYAEYLISRTKIDIHADCESIFRFACKRGQISMAKWIITMAMSPINNNPKKYPININILGDHAFQLCCEYGHLDIAAWLIELSKESCYKFINIHADDEYVFNRAILNGNLLLAMWLHNVGMQTNSPIDFHINNEIAFINSCGIGNIEITKWLYRLGIQSGNNINIRIAIDNAFIASCKNGHLKTAKWLFKIGKRNNCMVNIHANEDTSFISACRNGHIDIAKWLVSKSDKYGKITISANKYSAFNCSKNIHDWLIDLHLHNKFTNIVNKT